MDSKKLVDTKQQQNLIGTEHKTRWQKFEHILDISLQGAMVFTGLGLAVLIFAQVFMRYVLQSPFAGIEEVAILLAVWVYFIGMGYATKQRAHIHGGIVSLVVHDPYKIEMIRFVVSIVCFFTAFVFGCYAAKYGMFVLEKGRLSLYLQWPKVLWTASMIFGFLLMAGYFLLQIVNDFYAMLACKNQISNLENHSSKNTKD